MAICEWCGKNFDPEFDADSFQIEEGILSYQNIQKCLCAECAVQAIEEQVEGVYFEVCEKCGKRFDYIVDSGRFMDCCEDINLIDCWRERILCSNCALEDLPFLFPGPEDFNE